ncbi:hypothetical protein BTR23_18475 [Alkalihalophilus pseudofirmus]|nr:hypothetical protein BTR23_18475 [Alkalihalophilus pseudofirmus]
MHGATGYLLQQFVSPHSNLRTDEFQNRYLFAIKLIEEVKCVIKQYATQSEEPETSGITMKETLSYLIL